MGFDRFKTLMADAAHPNVPGQREMAKVVFEAITGDKAPDVAALIDTSRPTP